VRRIRSVAGVAGLLTVTLALGRRRRAFRPTTAIGSDSVLRVGIVHLAARRVLMEATWSSGHGEGPKSVREKKRV
jgi:hypothetical protein